MSSKFLEHLRKRVLVIDGAMGTAIHNHDLDVETDYCGCENCPEILAASRPDVIRQVHESYLKAGADCIETDSFGGARHVLVDNGLEDRTRELNRLAAEIARDAAASHSTSDKPRFVLGSMGPGTKLITLGQIDWDAMHASYAEQAAGLIEGGSDALLLETCQDILQVKCALDACLSALEDAGRSPLDVPLMVSVTIEQTGTMLMGTSIEGALAVLRDYPVTSLGLNCATGPVEMAEHVQYLSRHWASESGGDRFVSVVPNAGLPVLVEGRTEYPLGPSPFVEAMQRFIEREGVGLVGGCCGTTPEHITELADAASGRPQPSRTVSIPPASCASLYGPTEYRQDTSFLIIGERCNASGSRAFKRLLEAEDYDGIVSLARQQMRDGSHVLDLNVDYAGRDNAADMAEIAHRLARQVDAPLMLDSTQAATLEAGLKVAPGKCLLNSANFEDGDEKFDQICSLAKTFGAGLVIGTIDEDPEAAMARTADRKLSITTRAIERATQRHGLHVRDIFIDPLVLPISTGMDSDRRSALELVEGTRRIAEAFPEVQLTCGLSNVSFGLKPAARVVLNSVFLHELVEAGMTSAIVHASKILPLNKIPDEQHAAAVNLIYDRRHESIGGTGLPNGITDTSFDPLQALIELFKDVDDIGPAKRDTASLTLEERLRTHIIDGEKEGLETCLDEARGVYPPLLIINDHLLDGMKTVGELFGSGQMQLPFVLQSAEVMKKAVGHLEPYMEKAEGETKGSIVLATVKGDVHDIGKNLVDIILSNNGYTVHNIGIKQPIADIISAWKETGADAIGLSGLLVKSVNVMEDNLKELNEQQLAPPVILGGAALTRTYAEGHLRSVYEGSCYYGKDAFDGLRLMDMLTTGRAREIDSEIEARSTKRSDAERVIAESRAKQGREQDAFEAGKTAGKATGKVGGGTAVVAPSRVRSDVATDVAVPVAPFFGSRVVCDIDLDSIYPFINPVALFRGQWQFKKGKLSDSDYQAILEDKVQPVFERLKAQCRDEALLKPQVVYGYYPVNSEGDDLIIYHPEDAGLPAGEGREIERFTFPRQSSKRSMCISDFFRSTDESLNPEQAKDVLGMSCVTMGSDVSAACKKLFDADDYREYLYLHGMGVETAEALAEVWHKRMRQELGIAGEDSPVVKDLFRQTYRGSRYSFGYPACPDMSDQDILWRLIEPDRIGCELTENWQIDPEQSTSAIIVHHPEAKYFNV